MKSRTYPIGSSTLTLKFGDLTTSTAEALVSSDDSYITMGGGVSEALRRAGGEAILLDAYKKTPAELGDVVVTCAGALPAKHIFHAITIGHGALTAREILRRATKRCLDLLDALRLRSIAFPTLGAGAAGFSYDDVAVAMAEVIVDHARHTDRGIDVTLYLFDRSGAAEPMDYVQFFEEFAARSRGFLAAGSPAFAASGRASAQTTVRVEPSPEGQRRHEIVSEIDGLHRERESLERRLADAAGGLGRSAKEEVERRLRAIQERRVALLSSMKSASQAPISAFVSYSHKDEEYRQELGAHLSVLERQGIVSVWHDRLISAGSERQSEIDRRLEESRLVLLLISADFLSSPYCYEVEMRRALERHEEQQALVVPIIVRPVSLGGTPFEKLQILPKDARAVTGWPNRDSAYVDITDALRAALRGYLAAATG